jgi:hypothetical protein
LLEARLIEIGARRQAQADDVFPDLRIDTLHARTLRAADA